MIPYKTAITRNRIAKLPMKSMPALFMVTPISHGISIGNGSEDDSEYVGKDKNSKQAHGYQNVVMQKKLKHLSIRSREGANNGT